MLILASRSPQRREILTALGIPFEVVPGSYDESLCPETDPARRAVILAEAKAKAVAANHPGRFVIGVDTLVVSQEGELLEKPVDSDDARRMIRLQSGKRSAIHSGICVVRREKREASKKREKCYTDLSTAYVTFKVLSDAVIDGWIASGMWEERSGGFQIDLPGEDNMPDVAADLNPRAEFIPRHSIITFSHHPLIASLEGEYETVVGFPVQDFLSILDRIDT